METVSEKPSSTRQPIWIPIIQVIQVLISVIILGLSAWLIHGKYFDTIGWDIVCSLFTWLAIVFFFLTAYISSLRNFKFITFVVIAVNGLMVLFWLAAMGATAHLRTTFKYSVNIYGCYDDGSDVDSTTCVVYKRQLEKRAAVATKAGLSAMSAIAGLSALEMLLFIATLVYFVMTWYKSRSKTTTVTSTPQKQEEGYPMSAPQQPQQSQYAPVPQQQAYAPPQQQYVQQPYEQQPYEQHPQQQQPQQYAQQTYSPPPQAQQMPGPPQGYQSELPTPTHH